MSGQTAELEQPAQTEASAIDNVTTAVAKFDRVAAGLAELKDKYSAVLFDVTTAKGMKDAATARAAIRAVRVDVERVRKECKAPVLALGKEIDARAAAITPQLLALEEPIDQQIKLEEARREAEKQRKAEVERLRIAGIHRDIDSELRNVPTASMGGTAHQLATRIIEVVAIEITPERFAEFVETAASVKESTLTKLREMHTRQIAFEVEQDRLRLEREELARQKAAQDEANRAQAERFAAAEAERQRAIDEGMAKLRAERAENERVAREQQAQREREDAHRRETQRAEDELRAAEHRRQQEDLEREQKLQRARWAEIDFIGQQVTIAVAGDGLVRVGGTRECIAEILAGTTDWEVTEAKFGPLYHVALSAKQTAIDAITRELQAWDARAEAQRVAAEQAAALEQVAAATELSEAAVGIFDAPPDTGMFTDADGSSVAVVEGHEFCPTANDIVQLVSSEYGVDFGQALVWCMNAFDPELILAKRRKEQE